MADKAIRDFDEAIRFKPKFSHPYGNRGIIWTIKKDYDRAIKDFDRGVELEPKNAKFLVQRGLAWRAKREFGKALHDFDKAILIDPKSASPVIFAHFTAREAGHKAKAEQLLKAASEKLDNKAWPYPVLQFLAGEMNEPALLKLATDNDRQTEARCYLGLDHALNKRKKEATAQFRWVRDHGNPHIPEHRIAVAELERLEQPQKSPNRRKTRDGPHDPFPGNCSTRGLR